ncbi:MAG TPA: hypothetical protein VFC46_06780, partial [Humisphaera sp.]|nr:hypothetical protein [Humisphaera sp.]
PPPLPTAEAEPQQPLAVLSYQRPVENSSRPTAFFGGQPAQSESIRWAIFVGGIVTALAVRALFFDPDAPWWSIAAALCMAMLAVTIACWGRRPGVLYYAGMALNFAAAAWWLYRGLTSSWSFLDFLSTQAVAASIPGVAWLVLELQVFRQGPPLPRRRLPAFHHVAAIGGACMAIMGIALITADYNGHQALAYHSALADAALVSAIAIMFACLWDYRARYALAALYILGLTAICPILNLADMSPNWFPWALVMGFAGYGVATSLIFNRAPVMERRARDLGIPPRFAGATFWLPPANSIIALLTIAAACSADFNLDPAWRRMLIAMAAMSQTISFALLSARAKWPGLRIAAIATIPISAVLLGWAWLPFGFNAPVQHCAIAFIVFSFATCVFHLLLPRLLNADDPWRAAARTASGPLLALSVLSLSATLAAEGFQRANHPTIRLHGYAIAVFITILCGCAFSLLTALRPGNPPQFSRRSRIRFVYVSEALLAVAFAHLHLAEPQLFSGFLQPYWPLVVMAIAFAGVGAGEIFRRRENEILAEPLGQTGIFLPLLPVIGLWFLPAASVDYGTLLLVVAAFYGILAGMRRSIVFGALSALAANGAIWNTLSHSQSFGFTQHPQLWMIPAALSMLAGAQLNRDRLTVDRLAMIRYASLIAVYVSSTADIFLNGVERAPWMPLVLAALSVAGVLLGVLLRIRAFLFLGMSFLLLAIITMIYFASSEFHWTWIWYVAGILLGAGIIAMFALFEKKRDEMLALIEGLKKWE